MVPGSRSRRMARGTYLPPDERLTARGMQEGVSQQSRLRYIGIPRTRTRIKTRTLTRCFIVVDADTFQLQIAVAHVDAIAVNAMFFRNDLPELQWNRKRRWILFPVLLLTLRLMCSIMQQAINMITISNSRCHCK